MNYCLGLDNGGTTTKAAIYDYLGNEIAVSSTDTKVINPKPGFTERDMEEMWEAKRVAKIFLSGLKNLQENIFLKTEKIVNY